jgi:hypothetical protein
MAYYSRVAYKPTSLPKRELMENALRLWSRLELAPLT